MEQVLQNDLRLLTELVVLVVLSGVENDNGKDHQNDAVDETVQLYDGSRHFSGRDLLLEVNQLLTLRVSGTTR